MGKRKGKYLAPGHVPSDAKIENFIRTKYDSKRWVMEGPMPDPSTLDTAGDDDVPLTVVKEKTQLEKSASLPTDPASTPALPTRNTNAVVDLFGDTPAAAPNMMPKPATTATAPPKPQPIPRNPTKTGDSLLGFDFFGNHTQAGIPGRPSSAAAAIPTSNGPSRPDLKQSILSLYATGSRSSTPSQPAAAPPPPVQPKSQGIGDLPSDFGGLDFGAPAASVQKPLVAGPTVSATSSVASPPSQASSAPTIKSLSGGSFFDAKPLSGSAAAPLPRPAQNRGFSSSSGFGDFESATSPGWGAPSPSPARPTVPVDGLHDILNVAPEPTATTLPPTSSPMDSAFNLSAQRPTIPVAKQTTTTISGNSAVLEDPWASSNAWTTPAPAPAPAISKPAPPANIPAPVPVLSGADDWGWGSSGTGASVPAVVPAKSKSNEVTGDEDFGGWESFPSAATPAATQAPKLPATASKPGAGFGSNDNDLFSNVWG